MSDDFEPLTRDERDLLVGLAYDAMGQAGGLTRDDQVRLGELANRAETELARLDAALDRAERVQAAAGGTSQFSDLETDAGREAAHQFVDDAIARRVEQAAFGEDDATLPRTETPHGQLVPDPHYPSERWRLGVDLTEHTDEELTQLWRNAAELLAVDAPMLGTDLAIQLAASDAGIHEVTYTVGAWLLVELRYRPARVGREIVISVSCESLSDALHWGLVFVLGWASPRGQGPPEELQL